MQILSPEVYAKFERYPPHVKDQLMRIRSLIFAVAKTLDKGVDEGLKWGEPSYMVNGGTAVRIDWKPQSSTSLFLFVNCKTKLVDTFREVLPDAFEYQGNRALKFDLNADIPEEALRLCISVAFTYQKRKTLPLLDL
nr:DUF1801 domain-containing protein [Enterovibrio norvegicus]